MAEIVIKDQLAALLKEIRAHTAKVEVVSATLDRINAKLDWVTVKPVTALASSSTAAATSMVSPLDVYDAVPPSSSPSSVTTHTTEIVSELPVRCATPALVNDIGRLPDAGTPLCTRGVYAPCAPTAPERPVVASLELDKQAPTRCLVLGPAALNNNSTTDDALGDKSMGAISIGGKSVSVPVALEAPLLARLHMWTVPKPDAPARTMCSTKCSHISALRPVPWPSFADDTIVETPASTPGLILKRLGGNAPPAAKLVIVTQVLDDSQKHFPVSWFYFIRVRGAAATTHGMQVTSCFLSAEDVFPTIVRPLAVPTVRFLLLYDVRPLPWPSFLDSHHVGDQISMAEPLTGSQGVRLQFCCPPGQVKLRGMLILFLEGAQVDENSLAYHLHCGSETMQPDRLRMESLEICILAWLEHLYVFSALTYCCAPWTYWQMQFFVHGTRIAAPIYALLIGLKARDGLEMRPELAMRADKFASTFSSKILHNVGTCSSLQILERPWFSASCTRPGTPLFPRSDSSLLQLYYTWFGSTTWADQKKYITDYNIGRIRVPSSWIGTIGNAFNCGSNHFQWYIAWSYALAQAASLIPTEALASELLYYYLASTFRTAAALELQQSMYRLFSEGTLSGLSTREVMLGRRRLVGSPEYSLCLPCHGQLCHRSSWINVHYAGNIPELSSTVATKHGHQSEAGPAATMQQAGQPAVPFSAFLDHYWSVLTMSERAEQYQDSRNMLGHKWHLCAPWDPGGGSILQVFGDGGLRASRMLRRGECHVPTVTWANRWTGPAVSTHKASHHCSSIPLYSLGYIRGQRTHTIGIEDQISEHGSPL